MARNNPIDDEDTIALAMSSVIPQPRPDVEVGVDLNLPFIVSYQNSYEILRDEDITVKQLMAMRKTDGQARALYRLITLPIRAALKAATFVPPDGEQGGEEEATFIEQVFNLPPNAGGMTIPFTRTIAEMLMAVFDGFSAFEMVYQAPEYGPMEGKWTLKKIAHRPSDTLTFLVNDKGEFDGFRQRAYFKGQTVDVKIPGEHCVYYAANEEEKPFYGQSFFQAAFYHWDKKVKLYYIAHLAAQRAAVGTRVGTLPPNPSPAEKAEFKKALANLGVAQFIAAPDKYKVESLKEGGNFDFMGFINHHNSQMSKSILAAFFDESQGAGEADASMVDFSRQSDRLFLLMLETIMDEISWVINTCIIPRFIDWNFDSGLYPKFEWGPLTEKQLQAIRETFDKLAVAGQTLTISTEFVHELEKIMAEEFGLEIDYETMEAQMEEQAALEAEQAQLQQGQQQQMFDMQMQGQQQAMDQSVMPQNQPGVPGQQVPGAGPNVSPKVLPKGFKT